jgi:hypothetical protein
LKKDIQHNNQKNKISSSITRKKKKDAINGRRIRKEKATAQAEYNKAHKEIRQSVRKDRRTYIENLAAQAEEASNMRNMKDLYDTTNNIVGNFRQTSKQIKNKNGKVRSSATINCTFLCLLS